MFVVLCSYVNVPKPKDLGPVENSSNCVAFCKPALRALFVFLASVRSVTQRSPRWAQAARPSMFNAALWSRSKVVPQKLHLNVRIANESFFGDFSPQPEQVCEVFLGSTWWKCRPSLSAMSAHHLKKIPQDASLILLLRCLFFTILDTPKSSTAKTLFCRW